MKIIIILIFISIQVFASKIGIVDTNVLLIRDMPSEDSNKLGFYKIGDKIKVFDTIEDDFGKKWMKTTKGFVSAQFVFFKDELPSFLKNSEVDENLYSLRLASYDINAVFHKEQLKRKLFNEQNIYIKYYKNIYVAYLVNFESLEDVQKKQEELFDIFPNSVIYSKLQNKNMAKKKQIKKTNEKLNKLTNVKKIKAKKIASYNLNLNIEKNENNYKKSINNKITKTSFFNNDINNNIEKLLLNY